VAKWRFPGSPCGSSWNLSRDPTTWVGREEGCRCRPPDRNGSFSSSSRSLRPCSSRNILLLLLKLERDAVAAVGALTQTWLRRDAHDAHDSPSPRGSHGPPPSPHHHHRHQHQECSQGLQILFNFQTQHLSRGKALVAPSFSHGNLKRSLPRSPLAGRPPVGRNLRLQISLSFDSSSIR